MENTAGETPKIDIPKSDSETIYINTGEGIKNIKYPFNGQATNLIDKFLVFAYDQKTKEYTANYNLDKSIQDKIQTRFWTGNFQERPNVVNEICNDYHKDLLDNELISELIFPNIPKMYYLSKSEANQQKEESDDILTQTYQIIFSINPQDNEGSKKSYNGLGFTFYLNQDHKDPKTGEIKGKMFFPVTYCILSEFPYFLKFTEICKNIKNQLAKENDDIPIDIILYNTVKYLPSPIKNGIKLNFGATYNNGINQMQLKQENYQNDNKSSRNNKVIRFSNTIKDDGIPIIKFQQLSGYPLMDINMSFIFNLIPPEIIIEVFIFTFLEHDILFYSSRPEVLNMVMFIFSNLNYPFNDSIYYWHILSVSIKNFMTGNSTFVGKTCSTITGILNEYDPEFLTTQKIREHFVLDLDNKNFFYLYSEETEDVKKTMTLHSYIRTCTMEEKVSDKDKSKTKIAEKNYDDGVGLCTAIISLKEELVRRSKKVTCTNYNDKADKPSFFRIYEDEDEEDCIEANNRLQKAFFIFITQILQKYVQILVVNSDQDEDDERSSTLSTFKLNIKDQNLTDEELQRKKLANQAGQIFKRKFMESSKYNSFVVNFLQFHDTIDVYKIPYTFISEFIYYSHVAEKNNLSEVDVFKLIDKFYGKGKRLGLDDEINSIKNKGKIKGKDNNRKKERNTINNNEIEDDEKYVYFTFDNFVNYYLTNLKDYMIREQEDDKDSFIKVKKPSSRTKAFARKGFVLSNKILIKYMNYLNNLDDPCKEFHFLDNQEYDNKENKDNDSEECTPFESYELVEISEVVERYFILERCFTSYGLIKFSLLNVLAITRTFYKGNYMKSRDDIKKMCRFCELTKSLVRKYMFIYLNIFNALKKQHLLEDNICDECTKVIANYFNETNMIPTEAISRTLFDIVSKTSSSSIDSSMINKTIKKTDPFETGGTMVSGVTKNYYFNQKTSKSFTDILSIIETVFTGQYRDFPLVNEANDIKFFEDNYSAIKNILIKKIPDAKQRKDFEKEIKKKKFDLKTPLQLYKDTYNDLNIYLQKYSIEDIELENLYHNILCLIYYFKIPTIGNKWIETIRNNDKDKPGIKDIIIDKIIDKKKDKDKKNKNKDKDKDKEKQIEEKSVVDEGKEAILAELKDNTIPDIIKMLTELISEVRNSLFRNKKDIKG